jgi:hypothetical protein
VEIPILASAGSSQFVPSTEVLRTEYNLGNFLSRQFYVDFEKNHILVQYHAKVEINGNVMLSHDSILP